jgi:hypothetical protein
MFRTSILASRVPLVAKCEPVLKPLDGRLTLHKLLRSLNETKSSRFVNSADFHARVYSKLSPTARAYLDKNTRNIRGEERKKLREAIRQ